MNFVTEKPLWE